MRYLVAYDICSPQRLRRVARILEKHAIRCQKSVFIADVSREEIQTILDAIAAQIHPDHDIVQAWRLAPRQPPDGLTRGAVVPLQPAVFIHVDGRNHFIEPE